MNHRPSTHSILVSTTVLVGAALLATACSGSDESAPVLDSAVPVTVATTVTTSAPSTQPPTTATTVAARAPAILDDGALTDDCVQGDWVLDAVKTNALITTLLPGFPLTVDGTMVLAFAGDQAEQFINMVVTFTLPNGSISGALDQRFAGPFTVDADGNLLINADAVEGGWSNLTGTLGGVAVDAPVPPIEGIDPITGGPATCTDDTLAIQYTSGLSDAVAEFTRA